MSEILTPAHDSQPTLQAAIVELLETDALVNQADAATWREIALAAIGQLHDAHVRERQYRRRLDGLIAEQRLRRARR